jgi:hypothetical protein
MLSNEAEYDAEQVNACILFYDNLSHPTQVFNTDEIVFTQPAIIHQIRLVRNSVNPHPNLSNKARYPPLSASLKRDPSKTSKSSPLISAHHPADTARSSRQLT